MALSISKWGGTAAFQATGDAAWTNISNMTAYDTSYATVTLAAGQTSDTIRVTNFDFGLPTGAIAIGFFGYVYYKTSAGVAGHAVMQIYDPVEGLSPQTYNSASMTATTRSPSSFGSSGTIWGLTSLTDTDVNATGFGVDIKIVNDSGVDSETYDIDAINFRAYYVIPPDLEHNEVTTPTGPATSHVMVAPSAGNSIVAGESLLLLVSSDQSSADKNTMSITSGGDGWNKLFEDGSVATGCRVAGFVKFQATGNEGNVTIGTTGSCTTVGNYIRCSNTAAYCLLDKVGKPTRNITASTTNVPSDLNHVLTANDAKLSIAFSSWDGAAGAMSVSGTDWVEESESSNAAISSYVAKRSIYDNTTTIPAVTMTATNSLTNIGTVITLIGSYNHISTTMVVDDWRNMFYEKLKLTIDSSQVSGTTDLVDFPLLLTEKNFPDAFKDGDGLFDGYDATGDDLVFTSDSTGDHIIPHEVHEYIPNNDPSLFKCQIWVKVPSVSYNSDTNIYMWYKSRSTPIGAVGENNNQIARARMVWLDYAWVTHDARYNSDQSNLTMGTTGTVNSVEGPFGHTAKASEFTGSNDYRRIDPTGSGYKFWTAGPDWFMQAWVKPNASRSSNFLVCVQNPDTTDGGSVGGFALTITSDGKYGVVAGNSPWTLNKKATSAYTASEWAMVHGRFKESLSTEMAVFVNGVKFNNAHTQSWGVSTQNDAFTIGANSYVSGPLFDYLGSAAEVRLRYGDLSDDWVATEYNNQKNDGTFVVFDPEGPESSAVIDQEGFRWREDDGNESAATWLEPQDTNITRSRNTNTRLRMIINWPHGYAYREKWKLEYRKVGDPESEWREPE